MMKLFRSRKAEDINWGEIVGWAIAILAIIALSSLIAYHFMPNADTTSGCVTGILNIGPFA